MSLLRSKATRVFFSDNGTLSDQTEALRSWSGPNLSLPMVATEDALYIGRPHKFNHLYVALGSANTSPGMMSVGYWDGSAWEPFTDLLDETSCFSTGGFIQWEEKQKWEKAAPASVAGLRSLTFEQQLFWIKVTLSADTSALTSLRAVKQLLSDDRMLAVIHPEIGQYMPVGQSDFFPQHELAYESIVSDLIMASTISYADQIKNADDFMLAATYKVIELVLAPIAGDERLTAVKNLMAANYKAALKKTAASIDADKDEVLGEKEKEPGRVTHLIR